MTSELDGELMPPPIMTPRELKRWRFEMELNQSEAAALLGVSARTVCVWETGEREIPVAVCYACKWLQAQFTPE